MIIFRRQPQNFRLNCLSYHKKCSCYPSNPPPGALSLDPAGGSAPRSPPHPPHRNPGSATGLRNVLLEKKAEKCRHKMDNSEWMEAASAFEPKCFIYIVRGFLCISSVRSCRRFSDSNCLRLASHFQVVSER